MLMEFKTMVVCGGSGDLGGKHRTLSGDSCSIHSRDRYTHLARFIELYTKICACYCKQTYFNK